MDSVDGADTVAYGRAVQAVIWGIPAVNYDAMFQAFCAAGGAANQMVFWSRLCGWNNQMLTPNTARPRRYCFPPQGSHRAG